MNLKQQRLVNKRIRQRLAIEQQNKLRNAGIRSTLMPKFDQVGKDPLNRVRNGWQLIANEIDAYRVREVLNVTLPNTGKP